MTREFLVGVIKASLPGPLPNGIFSTGSSIVWVCGTWLAQNLAVSSNSTFFVRFKLRKIKKKIDRYVIGKGEQILYLLKAPLLSSVTFLQMLETETIGIFSLR